jgi:hypothetical protein
MFAYRQVVVAIVITAVFRHVLVGKRNEAIMWHILCMDLWDSFM